MFTLSTQKCLILAVSHSEGSITERKENGMSWSEVGGHIKFIKPAQCACDDVLVEGKYIGKAENSYGSFHKFRNADGSLIGLRGGHLDYLLEQGDVKEGSKVKVVFKGTHVLTEGPYRGKETHRFAVFTEEKDDSEGEDWGDFDSSQVDFSNLGV